VSLMKTRLPVCLITNGGGAGFVSVCFASATSGFLISAAWAFAPGVAAVAAGDGVGVGCGIIVGKNSRSCGSNFWASSGEENSIASSTCGNCALARQAANNIRAVVSVSA